MMISEKVIVLSAILFALSSSISASSNSWSAYSDGSSFRDVLGGRSYEEAFGEPYDSLFSSSLSGGYGGGGGGGSGSSYGTQERNPIKVIQPTQQRSDDFGYRGDSPKYQSPAVTVRSGHRSSYGSTSQSSYGSKGVSQSRSSTKGGYSGGKTSTKTTQQQQAVDDYDSTGGGYSGGGLSEIPDTGFQCHNREYGYYADVSAGCQIFHVCQHGQKWSFWCPEGTAYHQKVQTCDWAYNVDCPSSPDYYFLNERIGVLPPQDATLQRF